MIHPFEPTQLNMAIEEFMNLNEGSGNYVTRFRAKELRVETSEPTPLNLDGEGIELANFSCHVVPKALDMVLPSGCLLLT